MRRLTFMMMCLSVLNCSVVFGAVSSDSGITRYQERCAVCHGEKGDGRGPAAPSLNPKPMDFTSGLYKYRSTAWGSPPLDSDLERTIREGLQGTAMPAWGDLLSPGEVRDVIEVLKTFSPSTFRKKEMPIPVPSTFQAANREVGKRLYVEKGCAACHGPEGYGNGPLSNQLHDDRGRRIQTRDLTDHRNYRWGAAPRDMYLRIATGLNGTPMQGYANHMRPDEIQHLVAYLQSLYEEAEKARWTEPFLPQEPVHRGEYLTRVMVCQLCHTPINPDASYKEDFHLAGGMKVTSFPDGVYYSRNLTPDLKSGLGSWSTDDIKLAITRGTAKNGRLLYLVDMPWLFFSNLTDEDAEAIAKYLKSLHPIYNKIPPPQPSGFWSSLWRKTRLLFEKERTLQYHVENSGELDHDKGEPIPQAEEGYWSILPPVGWIPVDKVLEAARPELPIPASTSAAIEDAKRMRGRYLVSIAPCTLCHTAIEGSLLPKPSQPLSGGMKISCGEDISGCFGTVYAKNLTPDQETGLGGWTDRQIKRAIKSGITKDGRMMHWQAMPWDMFSNFTEADLEAIVAYLRSLPPVRKTIPLPTPTAPPGYLVYLGRDYGITLPPRGSP